jgi:uncharacterized protein YlxW (UPF0749 family)
MKPTVVGDRPALLAGQNLALILAGLLLGLVLVVRWQDVGAAPTEAAGARERAAQAVDQLEREQEQLKGTIAELREELASAQRQAARNTELLTSISADLERERMAAGLVALRGPGVVVQLDDSTKTPSSPGAAANDYLIHEYDLRDVVNLLWAGGAEAIAINDERLVNSTSIYCVGTTVMVNDTRLSPPYDIKAIGDRAPIQALLDDPSTLPVLRQRIKSYGVQYKVSWANQVEVPAYSGTYNLRYVHAGEVTP